ncbi:hypothetical protein TNCV_4303401 [Trichonephila clavipes]|nr:hypothetical protein TNCV_4303401 [Trichonephila clavipes]
MQGYTAADNVQDKYPPLESHIPENYSTGVAGCKHLWQSSYSKTVSFSAEYYEETTVGDQLTNTFTKDFCVWITNTYSVNEQNEF